MFFKRAIFKGIPQYQINGVVLMINQDGEYTYVPEECEDCHKQQTRNFKEYTEETVHVCPHCSREYTISLLIPTDEEVLAALSI